MTIPSLFPPSPATLLGGFFTSDTDRITSWNCWVLSASFWAIKAILSLNFLGLLPAMFSLVVLSLNHNKNENYFNEYLCSQQMWWLLIYHCRGDKDFPTLKLHILKVLLNFFSRHLDNSFVLQISNRFSLQSLLLTLGKTCSILVLGVNTWSLKTKQF